MQSDEKVDVCTMQACVPVLSALVYVCTVVPTRTPEGRYQPHNLGGMCVWEAVTVLGMSVGQLYGCI